RIRGPNARRWRSCSAASSFFFALPRAHSRRFASAFFIGKNGGLRPPMPLGSVMHARARPMWPDRAVHGRRVIFRPSSVLRRRFSYDTCMRLLIVEDDRDAADYLVKAFREIGHVADRAADGEEGLALALEGQYDVLVVDRMLPKLDGLSLIGQLRGEGVETPVLILSALGQVDDRVKGLRAGGDDY